MAAQFGITLPPGFSLGGAAGGAPSGPPEFTLKNLRLLFLSDSGFLEAAPVPVVPGKDAKSWLRLAIPLSAVKGKAKPSEWRGLALFADVADTFYVGQIKLIVDDKPIELEISADKRTPKAGELITFDARVQAGVSPTQLSWRIARPGGGEDLAEGRQVSYIYHTSGRYKVTCSARDLGGNKSPIEKSLTISVF